MARPTKWRRIENMPAVPFFVPSEKPVERVAKTTLFLEELEALRLKDLEGLEQGECAEKMEVSRPTFQRILLLAREKVADSLVNGKTIHIEGGNYTRNICPVKCQSCGREWIESFENLELIKEGKYKCECGSQSIICIGNCSGKFCKRNCHRNRFGSEK